MVLLRAGNGIQQMKGISQSGTDCGWCCLALCASVGAAYDMAKRIIHLVVKVGDLINKDPETKDLLRLYFLPDYNVSLAEVIIPGELL